MSGPDDILSTWLSTVRLPRTEASAPSPEVMRRLTLAHDLVNGRFARLPGAQLLHRAPSGDTVSTALARDITAGRDPACDLCLDDSNLSRTHFHIRKEADGWVVEDAASRNGTFVNGARTTRHMLVSGDVIEAGGLFFVFIDE